MLTIDKEIIPEFTPAIFWDVDYLEIKWQKYSDWVIKRVLKYGSIQDLVELIIFYGTKIIIDLLDTDNNEIEYKTSELMRIIINQHERALLSDRNPTT